MIYFLLGSEKDGLCFNDLNIIKLNLVQIMAI